MAWLETDQTQAAYCAAHGINATTFSDWLASERRVGALAAGVRTVDTASSLVRQVLPSQPRERALPTQSPAAAPRTLTAVAVNLPTAALMSAARSACLNSATNPTASAASSAPIPTPGIELTAGTRWRIGLTEAVSPRWIAGLLRALDDYDPNAHTHTHATAAGWGNPC